MPSLVATSVSSAAAPAVSNTSALTVSPVGIGEALTSPFGLLAAGALGALIFLPGWWKLAVPAGLVGLLIAGNWSHCSQVAYDAGSYVQDETTGQPLATGTLSDGVTWGAGCPSGHTCSVIYPSAHPFPQMSCLTQLFPGGL